MIKKYIYLSFFVFFSNILFAQESQNAVLKNKPESVKREKSEKDLRNDLLAELEGTYQFIIVNKEKSVLVNSNLLDKIKSSREFVNPVYFNIDEDIKVYIPSRSEIESPGFVKLERVVYQSNK